MSVKESLAARFGGNIKESMGAGAGGAGGFTLPTAVAIPGESPAKSVGVTRSRAAVLIATDRLTPDPNQPRKEFDGEALGQLAESLRTRGQLQPIRVRWEPTMERWIIIAGERRWRAARLAGLPTVAAVEATGPLSEAEVLEEQLIENTVREDLKPVELARAFQAVIDRLGLSQRELAARLNLAQSTVAKTLALLALPGKIQAAVDAGELGPSEAYQLSKVADPAEQAALAQDAAGGRIKRDEIGARTTRPRGKPKPWVHSTDRVKVTLTPLAEDVTDDELTEAVKAALVARRKGAKGKAA